MGSKGRYCVDYVCGFDEYVKNAFTMANKTRTLKKENSALLYEKCFFAACFCRMKNHSHTVKIPENSVNNIRFAV